MLNRCLNCGNFSNAPKVMKGAPCEETPHCKESAREEREHQRQIKQEYNRQKSERKSAKNRRRAANLAARAAKAQDHANQKDRVSTR